MTVTDVGAMSPLTKDSIAKRTISGFVGYLSKNKPHRLILAFIFGFARAVPVLNAIPLAEDLLNIPLRGWRLHIVRRMSRGEKTFLPPMSDATAMLKDGMILFAMQLLYWMPSFLLAAVFSVDVVSQVFNWMYLHLYLGQTPGAGSPQTIVALAATAFQNVAGVLPFHLLFWFLAWPMYRIGMIRFAHTGDWKCFLQLKENFLVGVRRNYGKTMGLLFKMYLVEGVVGAITGAVTAMKLVPGIGIAFEVAAFFVDPVLWGISYTLTGYLWGSIAQELVAAGDIKSATQK